jgi:hypothetical protein
MQGEARRAVCRSAEIAKEATREVILRGIKRHGEMCILRDKSLKKLSERFG